MTHYVLPETDARLDYDKDSKSLYVAVAGPRVLEDFTPPGGGAKVVVARRGTWSESPLINIDYDDKDDIVGIEILLP